jgi:hypothetical protein
VRVQRREQPGAARAEDQSISFETFEAHAKVCFQRHHG